MEHHQLEPTTTSDHRGMILRYTGANLKPSRSSKGMVGGMASGLGQGIVFSVGLGYHPGTRVSWLRADFDVPPHGWSVISPLPITVLC